jgi:hypothetical protein
LSGPRGLVAAALVVGLLVWYAIVDLLPTVPLWADVAIASLVLMPAVFALVLLALPWRHAGNALVIVGAACALAAVVTSWVHLDVTANFLKLAAATAIGFWFLNLFERLSWVVLVAAIIPVVDAISVWRGPTNKIVTDHEEVFSALSFGFPVPDDGSFQLGIPDLLFFAVFLGAADRWGLRVGLTWIALVASFGITMALAVWADPFGIGGLPALPALSIAFLAANADLLWRDLRPRPLGESG